MIYILIAIIDLIFVAFLFLLGVYVGGKLEEKRYLKRYPKLGRIRVSEGRYAIDFGIDPSNLKNYKGALMDIGYFQDHETPDVSKLSEDEVDKLVEDSIREIQKLPRQEYGL